MNVVNHIAKNICGVFLIIFGCLLIFTPGPGLLTILAGLYILDMMIRLNRKPSQLLELLFSKVGYHYYDRIDSSFTGDRKDREQVILQANPARLGGVKVIGLDTTDGFKFKLEDGGFLLIRFSGTEPILRVYTETTFKEKVKDILDDGLHVVHQPIRVRQE